MKTGSDLKQGQDTVEILEATQPSPATTPQIYPLKSIITLGIIFIICIAAMLLRIYSLDELVNRVRPTASPDVKPTATPDTNILTTAECAQLKYTIRTDLDLSRQLPVGRATEQDIKMRLNEPDAFKALLPQAPNARDFMYYPRAQVFLYIDGKDTYEDPTGTRTLHLYNLKDGTDKEIFNYKTSALEAVKLGTDYDGLSGIGLSDDGKKVVITSNAKVWMYTIATQEVQQVFADQSRAQTAVFYAPQLSPDQTKVLLQVGYYEGSSSAVLDLISGKLVELPYSSYVVGERPIGWDGSLLLVLKYEEDLSKFCWVHWDGSQETCLGQLPSNTNSVVLNDHLQGLITKSEYIPSGESICNNINYKYEVDTNKKSLVLLDVQANTERELLLMDATRSSGMEQAYDLYQYAWAQIDGQQRVIAKVFVKGEHKYLAIDPTRPDQYQVLQFE